MENELWLFIADVKSSLFLRKRLLWSLLKPRRVKGLIMGEIEILFWEPVSGGNGEL